MLRRHGSDGRDQLMREKHCERSAGTLPGKHASASMAPAAAEVAGGTDTADLGDPAPGAWMPACVASIR
jgi:hypothetical protein